MAGLMTGRNAPTRYNWQLKIASDLATYFIGKSVKFLPVIVMI